MSEEITLTTYFIAGLFMISVAMLPISILGIEFIYKFNKYGKFETKKYKYWRERKNA